jgi:hypothetical protein
MGLVVTRRLALKDAFNHRCRVFEYARFAGCGLEIHAMSCKHPHMTADSIFRAHKAMYL